MIYNDDLITQVVLSFDVLDMGDIFISSKHQYEVRDSLGTRGLPPLLVSLALIRACIWNRCIMVLLENDSLG